MYDSLKAQQIIPLSLSSYMSAYMYVRLKPLILPGNSIMGLKDQHDISADNVWDDSLLINAYNGSLNFAKEELARRLAHLTNKSEAPLNTSLSCNGERICQYFQKGDYVRATYIDGCDYEAKILSLKENGTCLLKYIGYNNVQEAYLSNVVTSWGKKARRIQFLQANINFQDGYKQNEAKEDYFNLRNKSVFSSFPPKPPMPFIATNDSCDHLSAMLMAWYMSGYYTGIYEYCKNLP